MFMNVYLKAYVNAIDTSLYFESSSCVLRILKNCSKNYANFMNIFDKIYIEK